MARAGLDEASVIAAAAELADAEGLAGLTLAALATRLNVRSPSLLHHVDSIAALRRHLMLKGTRGLGEALSKAALGLSGADAVRAMAHAYRAYALEHPGLYAACQVAPSARDAEAIAAATNVYEVVAAAFRSYGFSRTALVHEVRSLRASLHGFVALESIGGFGMPEAIDASFRRLIDIHLAALAGR